MTDRQIVPAPPDTVAVAVAAVSDTGGRPNNEDVAIALALPEAADGGNPDYLLAVADGMGGHAAGELASRLAIETLEKIVRGGGDDAADLLKRAFRSANEAIAAAAVGDAAGMGTTLTAALLRGRYATVASVGDSRAYLLRAGGLTQITRDHTLVAEQVARGELPPAAARTSPQRNVLTHVLGGRPRLEKDLPPIYELTLLPEDRLLLCTDGFHDVLEQRDFVDVLRQATPDEAAARLVALAKERATTDNVSAVVAVATPTRVAAAPLPAAAGRGVPWQLVAIVVAVIVALVVLVAVVGGVVP